MVRRLLFSMETDVYKGYFMVAVIMWRSVNPARGNQMIKSIHDELFPMVCVAEFISRV